MPKLKHYYTPVTEQDNDTKHAKDKEGKDIVLEVR
jgi:hypothetical protein